MASEKNRELAAMQQRIDKLEVRILQCQFLLKTKEVKQARLASRQSITLKPASIPKQKMLFQDDATSKTSIIQSLHSSKKQHRGIIARTVLKVVPEEASDSDVHFDHSFDILAGLSHFQRHLWQVRQLLRFPVPVPP
jgi:hypothetical protein